MKIPSRSPGANVYAERFVLTARTEVTGRMLIFGERHLRLILDAYAAHYNGRRPNRSHELRPPRPDHPVADSPGSGSSAGPFPAASSANTSGPRRSPSQDRWPSSGTPQVLLLATVTAGHDGFRCTARPTEGGRTSESASYGSQAQYGGEIAARCRWDREVHLVTEARWPIALDDRLARRVRQEAPPAFPRGWRAEPGIVSAGG